MKNSPPTNPENSPTSAVARAAEYSPWQRLKGKNVAYLTLPLLIMATVVEFVILATGWKYQQMVCLPQGMGVTFFGIGPIGATILAVELLKLPLAIWTASRQGWQKGFMLVVGLPLICVLTFQLVKDMAVYEMGVAMTPASQMLEKAATEEVRIVQLNGNLTFIEAKRAERDRKLTELAARKAKAKADFEELVKRNEEARQDAISLTDYQKRELSDMEIRQSTLIRQFDADAAQITKAVADLRAQREAELVRATKWNAEEARIENDFKVKLAAYTNKKTAYEKNKAEYDGANILKRQLMKEPVAPGVPPERESNTVLKPTAVAEIDAQISAKQAELLAVSNKRREGVAQVSTDARRLRDGFDLRSTTKRTETDRKREELSAAQATQATQWLAEEKQIDQEFAAAALKTDGIRAEVDAARKKAEGFYEAREASIRNTQVHRIATTVEIVRGLLLGERPLSITATAKERGDVLTDQISMVRIWVYPVLAFIVAFLPTLMVEIGFSTLFKPEQQRPPHRLGFLGRRLHWLYTRAGRQKILRAERLAGEASAQITARDKVLVSAKAAADKGLTEKEAELKAARDTAGVAKAEHAEQLKQKEEEWVGKLAGMADSLNRAIVEKDALRDLQKSEVERQIQMRQNAWSDRVTNLRQELDDQRAAAEAERTTLIQEQHQKLMAVTEDCKTQVIQARRQMADAELAVVETSAKLSHDLKEALQARDTVESQLKQQAESFSRQLTQAKEDGARELEKVLRQEKPRLERLQAEAEKALRQRDEDFARRLQQREQELSLAWDARVVEEKNKAEQESRRREAELALQFEARAREVDARRNKDVQQREDAAQTKLRQREQQMQAQAESRLNEVQTGLDQEVRRQKSELERQLDAQAREADVRLREELQQRELAFHARLKQREQELAAKTTAREVELQSQSALAVRTREEEWQRQVESRVRAVETRLTSEARQAEENFQLQLRQREQQLSAQVDARQAEARQREQDLVAQLAAQAEAHQTAQAEWRANAHEKARALGQIKIQLDRTEQERDGAKELAAEGYRQVQNLEMKLADASAFFAGLNTGKHPAGSRPGRDATQVVGGGSRES